MTDGDPTVTDGVRRTVGQAALHRLRRIVDEENAQADANARWALRFGVFFALAAGLLVLWLAARLT